MIILDWRYFCRRYLFDAYKLITEFNNVKIDDYEAFVLIYYALANCSVNTAQKYVDYLMKLMGKSVDVSVRLI